MRVVITAAMVAALIAATWLALWRNSPKTWDGFAASKLAGDEGTEMVYLAVGNLGGPEAYDYLVKALHKEEQEGANDVVLSGIVSGIVGTQNPSAPAFLGLLFWRYADSPRNGDRYIAVLAAAGLQDMGLLSGEDLPSRGSAYSFYGVSNDDPSHRLRSQFEERFTRLEVQVARVVPAPRTAAGPYERPDEGDP